MFVVFNFNLQLYPSTTTNCLYTIMYYYITHKYLKGKKVKELFYCKFPIVIKPNSENKFLRHIIHLILCIFRTQKKNCTEVKNSLW